MVEMRVLILDEVRDRPSLAAAKALVMSGWTVGIAGAERSLAARSKACAAWHPIVPPERGDDAFVESVEEVVRSHGYETVLPGYEPAIVALSARRERLAFPLGYGAHEGILAAIDKWRLVSLAQAAGLDVPRTVPASADRLAELDGPVVIKSASPRDLRVGAAVFTDRTAALAHADTIMTRGGHPIAQGLLDGRLDAVSLVAGPDGIVSIAQQVAEQCWPRPVGVTARGRTVPIDSGLRAAIERLLGALGWQGLAQLQFLVAADGRPRLIDFNPRFYGSLALAVRAGANHPDTWARLTTGRPVTPSEGRPGARYQWFSRDLRASLTGSDSIRETVRCLTMCPVAAHTLLSLRDPVLAPMFLLEQAVRHTSRRVRPRPVDAVASARLHGVGRVTRCSRASHPARAAVARAGRPAHRDEAGNAHLRRPPAGPPPKCTERCAGTGRRRGAEVTCGSTSSRITRGGTTIPDSATTLRRGFTRSWRTPESAT
ncbi:MAG: ATP-grasp domain-containing protein [Solirubrobacterales bacterium]|nr:ATP-grasp domain-containing protein [Solirubrobacterales bacterium]